MELNPFPVTNALGSPGPRFYITDTSEINTGRNLINVKLVTSEHQLKAISKDILITDQTVNINAKNVGRDSYIKIC